jgi:hypothetical protein
VGFFYGPSCHSRYCDRVLLLELFAVSIYRLRSRPLEGACRQRNVPVLYYIRPLLHPSFTKKTRPFCPRKPWKPPLSHTCRACWFAMPAIRGVHFKSSLPDMDLWGCRFIVGGNPLLPDSPSAGGCFVNGCAGIPSIWEAWWQECVKQASMFQLSLRERLWETLPPCSRARHH